MKRGWVYILECSDGSYYTCCASQLEMRIAKHQAGKYDGYTAKRRPVTMLWSDGFSNMYQAITAERQIKGWTRKKKEALIRGDFDLLQEQAECKNITHHKNNLK